MPSLTVRTAETGREEVRQAIPIYKKLKKKLKKCSEQCEKGSLKPLMSAFNMQHKSMAETMGISSVSQEPSHSEALLPKYAKKKGLSALFSSHDIQLEVTN